MRVQAKHFAREWLWLVGSFVVLLALMIAFGDRVLSTQELREGTLFLYISSAVIRLTVWAVRTVARR